MHLCALRHLRASQLCRRGNTGCMSRPCSASPWFCPSARASPVAAVSTSKKHEPNPPPFISHSPQNREWSAGVSQNGPRFGTKFVSASVHFGLVMVPKSGTTPGTLILVSDLPPGGRSLLHLLYGVADGTPPHPLTVHRIRYRNLGPSEARGVPGTGLHMPRPRLTALGPLFVRPGDRTGSPPPADGTVAHGFVGGWFAPA